MSKNISLQDLIENRKVVLVGIVFLAVLALAACGAPAPPQAPATTVPEGVVTEAPAAVATEAPAAVPVEAVAVSFSKDVNPILQKSCFNCHGGERTSRGLSFASYDTLMAGSQNGAVIDPGNPDGSKLLQLILSGKMPKRGDKLTPEQAQLISDWIAAGAQNN